MELRHLRYFVAVAEELSFRKAAQRLNVSRPALSKQIKDLEDEISVKLLERDTVSVSLTKAGELFLEDSQKLLLDSEQAIERAHQAQSGHRGKFRIGSVGILATEFLPKTLKIFNQKYPGVEVEFVEMLPTEQLRALPMGKIDIGFAYGKEVENMTNLSSLCVIHSIFGVAVSRQHPLAEKKEVTLKDLRWETLLCVGGDEKTSHRDAICRIYTAEGTKPGKYRKIEGFDSMITLIAADQGISILPHVLDLANQDIVILPLVAHKANLDFHMWAVWEARSASHHVKHFIGLLEERVQGSNAVAQTAASDVVSIRDYQTAI
jgi:LysR family transcriptional regulator, benzoate and cis,cis-muconate-responsive activator of ben and cat genes